MAIYSDLPHQCDMDAYKKEMQALEDKCDEINSVIRKQYFAFYQNLISLCKTQVFNDEKVCCINGQNYLTDTVRDIKEKAENVFEENKYAMDWITSRRVWYELDSYYSLWLKANKHINEICAQKRDQEGFNKFTDPDSGPLCTFCDELEKRVHQIERDWPAYTLYSYYMSEGNGGYIGGGGGAGAGRRTMSLQ